MQVRTSFEWNLIGVPALFVSALFPYNGCSDELHFEALS
jgi:hypothetical protein